MHYFLPFENFRASEINKHFAKQKSFSSEEQNKELIEYFCKRSRQNRISNTFINALIIFLFAYHPISRKANVRIEEFKNNDHHLRQTKNRESQLRMLWNCLGRRGISVTTMGSFWKVLVKSLLSKVAQKLDSFVVYFKKKQMLILLGNFLEKWATLNSNIWPHILVITNFLFWSNPILLKWRLAKQYYVRIIIIMNTL